MLLDIWNMFRETRVHIHVYPYIYIYIYRLETCRSHLCVLLSIITRNGNARRQKVLSQDELQHCVTLATKVCFLGTLGVSAKRCVCSSHHAYH